MCAVWGSESVGCEVLCGFRGYKCGGIRWDDGDTPASGSGIHISPFRAYWLREASPV